MKIICKYRPDLVFFNSFRDALALDSELITVLLADVRVLSETEKYLIHLSEAERKRLDRLLPKSVRDTFIMGRLLCRKFASEHQGVKLNEVVIEQADEFTKPCFQAGSKSLFFNISHSGTMLAVAFSKTAQIGIDIERMREGMKIELVSDNYFTDAEQGLIFESKNKNLKFFELWTRKESVVKLIGSELLSHLRFMEVLDGENHYSQLAVNDYDTVYVESYLLNHGFPISVATFSEPSKLAFYQLTEADLRFFNGGG